MKFSLSVCGFGIVLLFSCIVQAEESAFAASQKKLKAAAPEEYAKIEKLALTDMEAAMRSMRELARQKNIELPRPQRNEGQFSPRNGEPGGQGDFGRRRRAFGDGGNERGGRPRFNPNGGRGPQMFARLTQEIEFSKKFPAEFAVMDQKNAASEEEYRLLAKKAGVEPVFGMEENLRILRRKAGPEFDAAFASMKDDPQGAMTKISQLAEKHGVKIPMFGMRGGMMPPGGAPDGEGKPDASNPGRRIGRVNFNELRRKHPEEMKQYDKLLETDRRAAQELLQKIVSMDK